MVGGHFLLADDLGDLPPGVPVHRPGPEHGHPGQPCRADEQRRRAARGPGEPAGEAVFRFGFCPARPPQQGVQAPDSVVEQHPIPGHADSAHKDLIGIFKDEGPAAQLADAQAQHLGGTKDDAQHQFGASGLSRALAAHPVEQRGQPRHRRPPGPGVQREVLVQLDKPHQQPRRGVQVKAGRLVLHTDHQVGAGGLGIRHRDDGGERQRAEQPQQQRPDDIFCFLLHRLHRIL